jgi:hypothetical protein
MLLTNIFSKIVNFVLRGKIMKIKYKYFFNLILDIKIINLLLKWKEKHVNKLDFLLNVDRIYVSVQVKMIKFINIIY